jgi:hypothetical protein
LEVDLDAVERCVHERLRDVVGGEELEELGLVAAANAGAVVQVSVYRYLEAVKVAAAVRSLDCLSGCGEAEAAAVRGLVDQVREFLCGEVVCQVDERSCHCGYRDASVVHCIEGMEVSVSTDMDSLDRFSATTSYRSTRNCYRTHTFH